MNRKKQEQIKSITLVILIITALLQVGILWSYQNHGFPTNILPAFIGKYYAGNAVNIDEEKKPFFDPYRLVVSSGDVSFYIVEHTSPEYLKLWEDTKIYLKEIIKVKPEQTSLSWGEIVTKKGVIVEYCINIRMGIIHWFMNSTYNTPSEPGGIYKIFISPEEDVNINKNTIYILDNNTIYKYSFTMPEKALKRADYDKIIKSFTTNPQAREYLMYGQYFKGPNMIINAREDILIAETSPRYKTVGSILCTIPEDFKMDDIEKTSDIEKIGNSFVGRGEMHSYDASINFNNTIIFKNTNNIFRLHNNGLLEYNYLPVINEADKGTAKQAFEKVLDFIVKRKSLIDGTQLYVSGFRELKDSYEFTFDYRYGEYPILINFNLDNSRRLNSAIVINANSKRVINCAWLFRKFSKDKNSELKNYDIFFTSFADEAIGKYPHIFSDQNIRIKDISIAYECLTDGKGAGIYPVWSVTSEDNEKFAVNINYVEVRGGK